MGDGENEDVQETQGQSLGVAPQPGSLGRPLVTEVQGGVGEIVYPPEASWRVMRAGAGRVSPHDMRCTH